MLLKAKTQELGWQGTSTCFRDAEGVWGAWRAPPPMCAKQSGFVLSCHPNRSTCGCLSFSQQPCTPAPLRFSFPHLVGCFCVWAHTIPVHQYCPLLGLESSDLPFQTHLFCGASPTPWNRISHSHPVLLERALHHSPYTQTTPRIQGFHLCHLACLV